MLAIEHPQQLDRVGSLIHGWLERADARGQVGASRHAMVRRIDVGLVGAIVKVSHGV